MNEPVPAKGALDAWKDAQAFAEEFARLVRKYVPEYPRGNNEDYGMSLLYQMQDATSVFSPYVWSKQFDKDRQG